MGIETGFSLASQETGKMSIGTVEIRTNEAGAEFARLLVGVINRNDTRDAALKTMNAIDSLSGKERAHIPPDSCLELAVHLFENRGKELSERVYAQVIHLLENMTENLHAQARVNAFRGFDFKMLTRATEFVEQFIFTYDQEHGDTSEAFSEYLKRTSAVSSSIKECKDFVR